MMTKIDERRNIIESLKISHTENIAGIDKRIKNLKISSIILISLSIVSGLLILISLIAEQLGFEILKWEKFGMTAMFITIFFINMPNDFYKFKLLKHLRLINDSKDYPELEKLNLELKKIIDRQNNRKIIIIVLILILIMGFWQEFGGENPYWSYMRLPILAFLGFIIIRFFQVYKELSENMQKAENTVANNV